jgi:hypothetical protein
MKTAARIGICILLCAFGHFPNPLPAFPGRAGKQPEQVKDESDKAQMNKGGSPYGMFT